MPSLTTRKLENPAFMLGSEHSSPRGLIFVDYSEAEATGSQDKVDTGKWGQEMLAYQGGYTPASIT